MKIQQVISSNRKGVKTLDSHKALADFHCVFLEKFEIFTILILFFFKYLSSHFKKQTLTELALLHKNSL